MSIWSIWQISWADRSSGPFDYAESGENWSKGWQTADEYLSGNVRKKLREAKRVAERNPDFNINVEALEKAQPKDLDASEIEVRIGSTWVDKEVFQQFMYETFETPFYMKRNIQVEYSPLTAEWHITGKSSPNWADVMAYTTFGTGRANAYEIMEDTLNLRDVRIYDTVKDDEGKERRVLNSKETTLAAQKQQAIKDAFQDWVWKDPRRRETLVKQYNELMNRTFVLEADTRLADKCRRYVVPLALDKAPAWNRRLSTARSACHRCGHVRRSIRIRARANTRHHRPCTHILCGAHSVCVVHSRGA